MWQTHYSSATVSLYKKNQERLGWPLTTGVVTKFYRLSYNPSQGYHAWWIASVSDTLLCLHQLTYSLLFIKSQLQKNRYKTAFVTRQGTYRFTVLPYGLKSGSLIWQRVIANILKRMNCCCMLLCMNDLIVFSNNFRQHLQEMEEVLDALRKVNITINASKSKFMHHEIS